METDQDIKEAIVRLSFEAGELRRERRNGWHHIGEDPESVAEHSHRATIVGYLLASFAKMTEEEFADVDPNYVVALITFHDMHEGRTGDDDLVQKQYVKVNGHAALCDQVDGLGSIGAKIEAMWLEVEERSTPAGILAKDAEILEMAFMARELVVKGNMEAQAWIDAVRVRLKSESAKQLIEMLNVADPSEWWKRLLGYRTTIQSSGDADAPR